MAFSPDVVPKLWVYGFSVAGRHFGAADPAQFHRGWPGLGFTHSLTSGFIAAAAIAVWTRDGLLALALLVGHCAHALIDVDDSVGTMLFFPFSTTHFSTGMWAHAATEGRHGDAAAYYASLMASETSYGWPLACSRGERCRHTTSHRLAPVDRTWGWLQSRLQLGDVVLVAANRSYFLHGACRIVAWTTWAHAFRSSAVGSQRGRAVLRPAAGRADPGWRSAQGHRGRRPGRGRHRCGLWRMFRRLLGSTLLVAPDLASP